MATLSKHGQHKILETISFRKAYCSDGTVLKNYGAGWKVAGKMKAGKHWEHDGYQGAVKRQQEKFANFPSYKRFFDTMRDLCPSLNKRSYVLMALQLSSHDPDGMWSDLDDNWETRGYLTFDDVQEICRAYDVAMLEQQNKMQAA